jgi:hypothetical protein
MAWHLNRRMELMSAVGGEVKTTLRLPDILLAEFKHLAVDERTSVNRLMIEAMRDKIASKKKVSRK